METAGFHPVNYSVAHSAPQRGGRRESESEPPHSRAGDTQEAGPEAVSSRGQRAPQEARLCRGVPGPHPRPPGPQVSARAHSLPGVLESQLAHGGGGAPGEQEPGSQSKRGWQHAEVAAHGRQDSSGRQTAQVPQGLGTTSGQAQPLACGGRAPGAGEAEPVQSSWRHRSCPTPAAPGAGPLGCGCWFYLYTSAASGGHAGANPSPPS